MARVPALPDRLHTRLVRRLVAPRRRFEGPAAVLTFDDGPDPVHTPQVLDLLAASGTHATFFLIGQRAVQHASVARRIAEAGHSVGSHTWSHRDPASLGPWAAAAEVLRGRRAVEQVLGRPVRLFRPVGGHRDLGVAAGVRLARVQTWLWSVDPHDWEAGRSHEELVAALAAVAPGDVVLLHDGIALARSPQALDRSATVTAVADLLAAAPGRGLAFASLANPAPR